MHRRQAACDGVAELRGALRAAAVEDVVALVVQHREMRVQARAGVFGIGLGHEAGGKAVAAGQALSLIHI